MESLSFVKARDVPGVLVQVTYNVTSHIMITHIVLGVTCTWCVFFHCPERKVVFGEGQARATSYWFVLGRVPQPTATKTS
jgi:hypothetical protein